MKVKHKEEITTHHTIELQCIDIKQLLRDKGYIPADIKDRDINVFFTVPGGGDWSGLDVEISEEHPVHIGWTVQEIKEP